MTGPDPAQARMEEIADQRAEEADALRDESRSRPPQEPASAPVVVWRWTGKGFRMHALLANDTGEYGYVPAVCGMLPRGAYGWHEDPPARPYGPCLRCRYIMRGVA